MMFYVANDANVRRKLPTRRCSAVKKINDIKVMPNMKFNTIESIVGRYNNPDDIGL